LLCGSGIMAGAFIARRLVTRMSGVAFKRVLDG
jgi:hypothetical protein